MTLEHVVMAIVVVAVAVVAFLLGRARGVQLGEDEIDPNDPSLFGAQKNMSLFGPRVPVQSTERRADRRHAGGVDRRRFTGVGHIRFPGRATFRHC